MVEDAGVGDRFEIDSCGTGGGSSNWYLPNGFSYHEGDPADPRMTRVGGPWALKPGEGRRGALRQLRLQQHGLVVAVCLPWASASGRCWSACQEWVPTEGE